MPDAVTEAPNVYKVLEENAKVRILDVHMEPGDKTEMHSHPAVVACSITGGKFKFTSPDGQSMELEFPPESPCTWTRLSTPPRTWVRPRAT